MDIRSAGTPSEEMLTALTRVFPLGAALQGEITAGPRSLG
jgi:hypothetical protein